jgi:protein-S-isoprenylcysteine O-methyltransferase Ste14
MGRREVALVVLAMLGFVICLVAGSSYRWVRHPMYSALFVYSVGQRLVLPNRVAGPSHLATSGILLALRVRAEEQMMLEEFGADHAAHIAHTTRVVPGV